MIADAAEGLHAAHELLGKNGEKLQLVHRDVTPHNLFVTYDGTTKVVDFGIAKFSSRMSNTRAGTLKGKLAYMSPEQARGNDVDHRADLFAMGVILWEVLAGRRLFKSETAAPRTANPALANDARFTSFLAQLRLEPAFSKRGEVLVTDPTTDERLEMEVSATEVRDSRGAVIAIVSVMQDIGRLRELERRRLEQVLFDSEKLAATGRLAASIAHEINNPLEAVQNALYLLQQGGNVADKAREYLDIAARETQRMSRILRQMLGFYRQTEVMAETDINALIEEAAALVAKRLRERG